MNDASMIKAAMSYTEAIVYTPEVNELYTTVVVMCKEASAKGDFHLRLGDWPITCTDETGLAVLDRLRSQRFEVIDRKYLEAAIRTSTWYTTTTWCGIGWAQQHDLPCDALEVQWFNPEMVQAAVNRTVKQAYRSIVDSCYVCAQAGLTSHATYIDKILYVYWDKDVDMVSSHTKNVSDLLRKKLIHQGFKMEDIVGSDRTCITW